MSNLTNTQLIDVYQVIEEITANLPKGVFTVHASITNHVGNLMSLITVGAGNPDTLKSLPGTHEHVAAPSKETKQDWWRVYAGQAHGMSIYLRYLAAPEGEDQE